MAFRIPTDFLLDLAEKIITEEVLVVEHTTYRGNVIRATRVTGKDDLGRSYDSWDFVLNPDD